MNRSSDNYQGHQLPPRPPGGRRVAGACVAAMILGAGSAWFSPGKAGAQQAGAGAEQRFRSEAPAKWEEYTPFLSRLQGTIQGKEETRFPDGRTELEEILSTVKQADGCYLYVRGTKDGGILRGTKPPGSGRAWGSNPRYAFQLMRTAEQSWLLSGTDLPDSDTRLPGLSPKEYVEREVLVPVSLPFTTLAELVKRPTFRVIKDRRAGGGPDRNRVREPAPHPQELHRSGTGGYRASGPGPLLVCAELHREL